MPPKTGESEDESYMWWGGAQGGRQTTNTTIFLKEESQEWGGHSRHSHNGIRSSGNCLSMRKKDTLPHRSLEARRLS